MDSLNDLPAEDQEDPLQIKQPLILVQTINPTCVSNVSSSTTTTTTTKMMTRTATNKMTKRSSKGKSLYTCDKCKKRFQVEVKYQRHVNLNYCDYARITCPYCKFGPKRYKNEIKRHILNVHKSSEIYFVDWFDGSRINE